MNGKKSVLVIEDEKLLLHAITRKLELNGLSVIATTSGKEALEILKNAQKLPNAIWLDYYLKDMNGLEFMNAFKANDKWLGIPTIVVSNSASPDNVSSMLALGVKKYYLKAEHRLEDIIEVVKKIIRENHNSN